MAFGEDRFCEETSTRKGAQDYIVRELLGHVAERLMVFEVEQRRGVGDGERSDMRDNSRNG